MSVANTGADTTAFGIMTGADMFTGGLLSGLADVSTIATAAGQTAVAVNAANAAASAPVVAAGPVVVNPVGGQIATGGALSGLMSGSPLGLLLLIVVIIMIAKDV